MQYLLLGQSNIAKIESVFTESCWDCHDEDMKKGYIQLDDPKLLDAEMLDKVFRAVRGGSMPPAKKKQLTKEQSSLLLSSLSNELLMRGEHHPHMRRMTKGELLYSLEDLLGIDLKQSTKSLISDEQSDHGFDVTSHLGLTAQHLEVYLNVIHAALDQAFEPAVSSPTRHISPRFVYDKHAKRPKIEVDQETTVIAHQPRTNNGTSFPYFRKGFVCEEEGWYEIEFECEPVDKEATVMMFAGVYYIDGALVFNRPRLVGCYYIEDQQTIRRRVYLKPDDEIGFSAMLGTKFKMKNPVVIEGPLYEQWPSAEVKKHLIQAETSFHKDGFQVDETSLDVLNKSLLNFAKKAYRKPVSSKSIQSHYLLAKDYFVKGKNWLESFKIGMSSILCSPDFLIIDKVKSENFLIAERLSFMLWKSIPDQTLLKLAIDKKLSNNSVLKTEFTRMLQDSKSRRFSDDFVKQWMNFKELESISADYRLYPEYDIYLRDSMINETLVTFEKYIKDNKPLKDMIDADYIYTNEKLAKHYGLSNIKGDHFRKVQLPPKSIRGGLMTQASLMMATSDGAATTPVKRGLWILEKFLNKHIPAPPKNIPGIEADTSGKRTILEQLALHRDNKDCRSCHTVIDAYGVAFESFDPIGQEREHYRILSKSSRKLINFRYKPNYNIGEQVISDYDMPNGDNYVGIHGFKNKIHQEEIRVYTNLAEKIMSYAKGRPLGPHEQLRTDQLGQQAYKENMGFNDFMFKLISSPLFKER